MEFYDLTCRADGTTGVSKKRETNALQPTAIGLMRLMIREKRGHLAPVPFAGGICMEWKLAGHMQVFAMFSRDEQPISQAAIAWEASGEQWQRLCEVIGIKDGPNNNMPTVVSVARGGSPDDLQFAADMETCLAAAFIEIWYERWEIEG